MGSIRVEILTWIYQLVLGSYALYNGLKMLAKKKKRKRLPCPSLKYFKCRVAVSNWLETENQSGKTMLEEIKLNLR